VNWLDIWKRAEDSLRGIITGPKVDGPSVTKTTRISATGYKMRNYTIHRTETGDEGTFGIMHVDGTIYHTLELPNRNNLPEVSRIPEGTYQVNWEPSPRLGRNTYRLVSVPGRSGILFHPANFAGDKTKGLRCELNGCIALGFLKSTLPGFSGKPQKAILSSREAMKKFEEHLAGDSFVLNITPEMY
jgi:hypothetical protein